MVQSPNGEVFVVINAVDECGRVLQELIVRPDHLIRLVDFVYETV